VVKKKVKKRLVIKKPKAIIVEAKQEHESEFDFGGLPNRDIKKNLGCG
jgi:hypothetical protein